jgi:curved DNA-binding protein CbpA
MLGVSPSATRVQAKAAYRRLARLAHPDTGGDSARFTTVTDAWKSIEPELAGRHTPMRSRREGLLRLAYGLDSAAPRVLDVRV